MLHMFIDDYPYVFLKRTAESAPGIYGYGYWPKTFSFFLNCTVHTYVHAQLCAHMHTYVHIRTYIHTV